MFRCAKHCTGLKAARVPRRAYTHPLHRRTLPLNDFLNVSITSFQAATPLTPACPFSCWQQPKRGPLCPFRAWGSAPHLSLLLWKLYEGLGEGDGGVFPSRSWLSPPRQVMWSQCHVTVSTGSIPGVHTQAVTQLSIRNTFLQVRVLMAVSENKKAT